MMIFPTIIRTGCIAQAPRIESVFAAAYWKAGRDTFAIYPLGIEVDVGALIQHLFLRAAADLLYLQQAV